MTSLESATMTIEESIDFILGHFEEPIWPRTIFTPKEKQVLVYNKEEAFARFKQAKLLDCRINAYPDYTGFGRINRQVPNFVFIDLDLSRFNSRNALDKALRNVQKNIKEKFSGAQATIIWSGNAMTKFYEEFYTKRLNKSQALRKAQLYIRDLSAKDLLRIVERLTAKDYPIQKDLKIGLELLADHEPEKKRFQDIYYWSPFVIIGDWH